jgi:hypothetical protein
VTVSHTFKFSSNCVDLKSKPSDINSVTETTSEKSAPETFQDMQQQRTNDLMNNINSYAPPKKAAVYKGAFIHAESLKIKKFQDKCKREETKAELTQ